MANFGLIWPSRLYLGALGTSGLYQMEVMSVAFSCLIISQRFFESFEKSPFVVGIYLGIPGGFPGGPRDLQGAIENKKQDKESKGGSPNKESKGGFQRTKGFRRGG